jgi:hypothetical protein
MLHKAIHQEGKLAPIKLTPNCPLDGFQQGLLSIEFLKCSPRIFGLSYFHEKTGFW